MYYDTTRKRHTMKLRKCDHKRAMRLGRVEGVGSNLMTDLT